MPKPSRDFADLDQRDENSLDMSYRSLELRESSIDIETRSIEADIASESHVLMPDFVRMEMVPEVLIMEGIEMPKSRQIPLLDSHNRSRVKDQLGSARELTVKDGKLASRLFFSEASSDEFTKVRERHVTDVSIGYHVRKKVYVPKGETKTIAGRSFNGPLNVVTKWKPREASMTPIGADEVAKTRGLDLSQCRFLSPMKKDFEMNEELRNLLIEKGMDSKLTDDEAQRWMVDNKDTLWPKKEKLPPVGNQQRSDTAGLTASAVADLIQKALEDAEAARAAKQLAFRTEVESLCTLADMPDVAEHCRALSDIQAVRTYLTEEKARRATNIGFAPQIRVVGDSSRHLIKEMQTALNMRSLDAIAPPQDPWGIGGEWASKKREASREKVFPVAERAKNIDRWKYATPYQMAEEYLRCVHGIDTVGLPRETVAAVAWFGPQRASDMGWQFQTRSGGAYHTTGNFANLTLDTINKTMMIGYVEAPSTWEGPFRRGTSVADFKNISRLRMGAVPNLPVWNDNKDPELASFADAREYYAVESRSLGVDFSYRLLVNDDMDAMSKTPSNLGDAAARTVNAAAWSPWTSNPDMSDGKALFLAAAAGNRKRVNLVTGAGAPSVSTLQTLTNQMMQMRGENTPEQAESQDILALMPKYIVGPSALRTTILQLVLSVYDPANANMTYNTASQLIPVIEPLLDASSTTAWGLIADPVRIDTVEVTFMQGQESPVIRMVMDERRLSQTYYVLQTFGVKAMNHRGLQKHAGA